MRTKTPRQIAEQSDRIFFASLYFTRPGYKVADEVKDRYRAIDKAARAICIRYINNIYRANGFTLDEAGIVTSGTTEQRNDVWDNAATPRKVYAGY